MLQHEEIIDILKKCNVMLEGHFLLTSGKHSAHYMQCAQLFQYPQYSQILCHELAQRFQNRGLRIDLVVGPAVGGIIMAYQMAACLGVRNCFAERENGAMRLRRGFSVTEGENILVCEDVVTTGGSVKEVISLLQDAGANVVGVGAIVDRSGGQVAFGLPFDSLAQLSFESFTAQDCPLCRSGSVAVKPGSRNI